MTTRKHAIPTAFMVTGLLISSDLATAQDMSNGADNFYKSDKVSVQKVTFRNKLNMNVVGNLFVPKDLDRSTKSAAIIVGHPMVAVKEQSANLYATKLAERGFVTLSFDLSFWGESDGQPRNTVAPDIYVEDFSAAVDFLGTRPFVNRDRIGALGICGSGSFAVACRPDRPATQGRRDRQHVRHGRGQSQRPEEVGDGRAAEESARSGGSATPGGSRGWRAQVHERYGPRTDGTLQPHRARVLRLLPMPRGEFTPESSSSQLTTHPTLSSNVAFMNFYPFERIETISPRPMLFITGDNAHSREFSEDAYKRAAEPKELLIVPSAGHVDLYDRVKLIPFDKLTAFFKEGLARKQDRHE